MFAWGIIWKLACEKKTGLSGKVTITLAYSRRIAPILVPFLTTMMERPYALERRIGPATRVNFRCLRERRSVLSVGRLAEVANNWNGQMAIYLRLCLGFCFGRWLGDGSLDAVNVVSLFFWDCVQWQVEVFVWGFSGLAVLCGNPTLLPLTALWSS